MDRQLLSEAWWQWVPVWEHWMAAAGNAASQRLIDFQQERELLSNHWQHRRDAYVNTATLSYFMYVCTKTEQNNASGPSDFHSAGA